MRRTPPTRSENKDTRAGPGPRAPAVLARRTSCGDRNLPCLCHPPGAMSVSNVAGAAEELDFYVVTFDEFALEFK